MKFRFYVDLPPYYWDGMHLSAGTYRSQWEPPAGCRRVAFDVDLPLKTEDEVVLAPGEVVEEKTT